MDNKDILPPLNFTESELGTIFSSLLEKNDKLKKAVDEFDGDTTLLKHLYEAKKGIVKTELEKQYEKANWLQMYINELKETRSLIGKISNYFDKRDGTITDLNEVV
ncbi:hypothetical protein CLV24_11914 [Pontibacter ummariensis]|uniref:Uncharacterized protein n=1 Tax=Pontibacter ummariensis TaxID=1610492 RepID=A0A239IUC7_9BACT|nr:hypothetical protein [Pontibacter ummariensis]PRY08964.1 hypothetical protein CLV24_11914 [Pontibacter ummariensis]SNS97187.1 hypothetical protein SAMN06296052_11914 [Pontibacter ummariensis]